MRTELIPAAELKPGDIFRMQPGNDWACALSVVTHPPIQGGFAPPVIVRVLGASNIRYYYDTTMLEVQRAD